MSSSLIDTPTWRSDRLFIKEPFFNAIKNTVFENQPKMSHFPPIFVLFCRKTCQIGHFWHFFYETVNVARFARNVEWDFFYGFQTPWWPQGGHRQIGIENTTGISKFSENIFRCIAQCLKITQNVSFEFFNFSIFTNFCPIKVNMSGNTVWPQASGFQKLAKWTILAFLVNFWPLKM